MIVYWNRLGKPIGEIMDNSKKLADDLYLYNSYSGWVCPKCESVWSPKVEECWQCNDKLSLEDNEENPN